MSMIKKTFLWIISFLLVNSFQVVEGSELSIVEDGLDFTLTTNKDVYKKGEEISLSLRIKNTNPFPVTNIEVSELLPSALRLKEEFPNTSIGVLEPDATYQLDKPIVVEMITTAATEPPSSETEIIQPGIGEKPGKNPKPQLPQKPEIQKPETIPNSDSPLDTVQDSVLTTKPPASSTPFNVQKNSIPDEFGTTEEMKTSILMAPLKETSISATIANKVNQSEITESAEITDTIGPMQEVTSKKEMNQSHSEKHIFIIMFGALAVVGLVSYLLYNRKTRKHENTKTLSSYTNFIWTFFHASQSKASWGGRERITASV